MNIQEVFNKVIKEGYYSHRVMLMCPALGAARRDKVITQEEWQLAIDEIKAYLKGYGSLGGKLMNMKLPYEFEHRMKIYKNWSERP